MSRSSAPGDRARLYYAGEHPHLSGQAYIALDKYRIDHGGNDLRLADVAPSLGISPVPVASARWYEGVTGLQAVEQPV